MEQSDRPPNSKAIPRCHETLEGRIDALIQAFLVWRCPAADPHGRADPKRRLGHTPPVRSSRDRFRRSMRRQRRTRNTPRRQIHLRILETRRPLHPQQRIRERDPRHPRRPLSRPRRSRMGRSRLLHRLRASQPSLTTRNDRRARDASPTRERRNASIGPPRWPSERNRDKCETTLAFADEAGRQTSCRAIGDLDRFRYLYVFRIEEARSL